MYCKCTFNIYSLNLSDVEGSIMRNPYRNKQWLIVFTGMTYEDKEYVAVFRTQVRTEKGATSRCKYNIACMRGENKKGLGIMAHSSVYMLTPEQWKKFENEP